LERRFGAGEVVFVSDSFPFTNEALRGRRDTALLTAAIGPRRRVIFDEAQLGTVQSGSVGQLLRRYRLQGAALTLLLLAALFSWRAASSFVPPRPPERDEPLRSGNPSDALAGLLRRSLTPATAAEAVLGIWNRSASLMPATGSVRRAQIAQQLKGSSEKELLEAWRSAHRLAARRTDPAEKRIS
jgi:hypothetical protein